MSYIDSYTAAIVLKVSADRVRRLCREKRIPGAHMKGRVWFVPANFKVTPGTRGPKPRK